MHKEDVVGPHAFLVPAVRANDFLQSKYAGFFTGEFIHLKRTKTVETGTALKPHFDRSCSLAGLVWERAFGSTGCSLSIFPGGYKMWITLIEGDQ